MIWLGPKYGNFGRSPNASLPRVTRGQAIGPVRGALAQWSGLGGLVSRENNACRLFPTQANDTACVHYRQGQLLISKTPLA